MKVAITHDYLVNKGGAERVVLALHRIWPDAPIFTAIYHPEHTFDEFAGADVRTSRLQRLSRSPDDFRRLLPVFGRTFRGMDLRGFDVVVSSSAGFAHAVRPADGCHIVYCHTPPRFLWDERYDHRAMAPALARPALPLVLAALRRADMRAASRVHTYVANSARTRDRIRAIYGREAAVVFPPVETRRFHTGERIEDRYLLVGRLMPHRNFELAVEAFTSMGRALTVVGDGPVRARLEGIAGQTVRFVGAIGNDELERLYAASRGVVVPGEEDFGIVPLEANASGRPVVALARGGALETVRDGVTGVLFHDESADAIADAVARADAIAFDPATLRSHAERFDDTVFAERMRALVDGAGACEACARIRGAGGA